MSNFCIGFLNRFIPAFRCVFIIVFVFNANSSFATQDFSVPTTQSLEGLLSYSMPKFPPELVGVKAGDAEVVMAITINDEGSVNDSVVLEATNQQVASAAISAVAEWKFSATEKTSININTPWPRREVLQFNFKRSGVVTSMSHLEAARDGFVSTTRPQLRTVQWKALDSEPQRIKATMPVFPPSLSTQVNNKPLMINFVIDQQGVVRVPVLTGVEDSAFAKVVLAAVKTWRYTPPMEQKQAVAVEVTNALVLPHAAAE